ncbi:MAG: phosphopyruvate hydratase [Chloroflexi bacterium]|nr:phosphopyruvate hydratase [Chloroflexota bacterium]
MSKISEVRGREVLDSRGNPTVEVEVTLSDGSSGRALVPSGASTGVFEALELRDNDSNRYMGKGVLKAVANVNERIAPRIRGQVATHQQAIDEMMLKLDGTENKSSLGANAILGVSMAVARAAAAGEKMPLYSYLSGGKDITLPVPMLNIINGGRHAENSADIQEFMVIPAGFDTFSEAIRAGVEIYHTLAQSLREQGLGTGLGDEGGFAPALTSNRQAAELIVSAIENAGYTPGVQCFIGLDVAASELYTKDGSGRYVLPLEKAEYSVDELLDMYEGWIRDYPIISIEDGIAEEDWDGWRAMVDRFGDKVQSVGDDLYTTNASRIRKGIELNASNAVLIKLNQIGTVSETLDAIKLTQETGWNAVISHRSGETEDTTIADLAVGTSAGQIKSGAPARGERTAKYNRLLRIEEELGPKAEFAGRGIYKNFLSNW